MITILVFGCLVLAACGGAAHTTGIHLETPTAADRTAILRATETAFFTSTGAPPDLRITGLEVAMSGSAAWARDTFAATPAAPAATAQGVSSGHDEGLLKESNPGSWTWLGYIAAGCRTAARTAPAGVVHLLGLPPVCSSASTPAPAASSAPVTGVTLTTLSVGDLDTMLSIFVSTKNRGPSGEVLSPTDIVVSARTPPLAARTTGGREWAMVTYVAASGAPEPLTREQLQDGEGTAFFFRQQGRQWSLSGLAGGTFCTGAAAAQIPAAVLILWQHPC